MSGHDSILTHAKSRYLWISLALMAASLAAYVWHDPGGPPNGGTSRLYREAGPTFASIHVPTSCRH